MAATADPRAKPPTAASHHLKPWAAPPPPRAHRVPSPLPGPAVTAGGAARDRRRSSSSSSSHRRVGVGADAGTVKEELSCDGRIKDLRDKLMGHLRDAADRLHLPPPAASPPKAQQPRLSGPGPEPAAPPLPQPSPPQQQQEATPSARPWNLRDRKCRRPTARGAAAAAAAAAALDASPTAWGDVAGAAEKARRSVVPYQERAPFAVALTAEEVEEDVYALTGARPRRRPRKRPRVVQRQLDSLFPGLWLTEITADAYKVPEE
ncbi:hypothetical protein BDA96_03G284000 [Sorghum bicolor]|uniref:DUF1639 family protein n=2 Tax=Sorghum bicolor TaxID=4558 RepID=A0A921UPY3_SORBI|nr:protein SCARECROW 1 [Sorghum bicolor]EES01291.1 hypothetical protein SORBI_3003G262100 [Sorghum bicolor]KAG0538990.1 hypothetical protein BDA96_03G284000 [Sorghum bicolor]|eukprot:XP_002456171.1 protein SCARECROW 1 [Sorghum bicolor]